MYLVVDSEGELFLLSLYNVDCKMEEKLTGKVSQIIALNPEIEAFRHIKYEDQSVRNVIVRKPKNLLIDGVDLKSFLAQEKVEMKLIDG